MKRLVVAALGLLLMGQAPPAASVDDLAWMSGRWEASGDGRWTEETWSTPRDGMMLGFSRSTRENVGSEFEFLRIALGPDGTPTYFAQPQGGAPVGFRLVAHDSSSATFENPAHDYPQRIIYRRFRRSMTATISSIDGSGERSWGFVRR
jgi:hypothetical protein